MIKYYCLMCDELGGEYGLTVTLAESIDVVKWLATEYPESGYISIRILGPV